MSILFNPFTANFDFTGEGSVTSWKDSVADLASLPATGNSDGDARITRDTSNAYMWDTSSSSWKFISRARAGTFGTSPNSFGLSVSPTNIITLQPADSTHPGAISIDAQVFAGEKSFLNTIYAAAGLDVASTVGTDVLNIGTGTAEVINIGNTGCILNFQGTTTYQNVDNVNVKDKNITVNSGGSAGSAVQSGLEIEEGGSVTGYVRTSSDRNAIDLKGPNTAGVARIVPGVSGITVNQSSHDPITLNDVGNFPNSKGSTLIGQQLQLQPADGSNPGVMTATDQTFSGEKTFNGNVIFAEDVSLPGVGGGIPYIIGSSNGLLTPLNQGNGQLLIGRAGQSPQPATLSQGSGITITNASGSITIALTNPPGSNDITETQFIPVNNQSSAANITGFLFANANVRSFTAQVQVVVSATASKYEAFSLQGIQTGTGWSMSVTAVGDESGYVFSITSAGQVQYTSPNAAGFTSAKMKFRAQTLSI